MHPWINAEASLPHEVETEKGRKRKRERERGGCRKRGELKRGQSETKKAREQERENGASNPFYSVSDTPGYCQVTVGQSLDKMLTPTTACYVVFLLSVCNSLSVTFPVTWDAGHSLLTAELKTPQRSPSPWKSKLHQCFLGPAYSTVWPQPVFPLTHPS